MQIMIGEKIRVGASIFTSVSDLKWALQIGNFVQNTPTNQNPFSFSYYSIVRCGENCAECQLIKGPFSTS